MTGVNLGHDFESLAQSVLTPYRLQQTRASDDAPAGSTTTLSHCLNPGHDYVKKKILESVRLINYGNGWGQQVQTLYGRTNYTLDYIGLIKLHWLVKTYEYFNT